MTSDESLRYPIGGSRRAESFTPQERSAAIEGIRQLPQNLRRAVAPLSEEQLETPYRPGGWTVRQLIHHVADSHMNAYVRCKLALTENEPTIKPYMENLWAELPEAKSAPVDVSLSLLDSLHRRWMLMLRQFGDAEWKRTFRHPELGTVSLEKNLALYAWHGKHHVAHITELRKKMGW